MSPLNSIPRFKSSPSKALSLSCRTQIECMDRGLRSVNGAKQLIELILSRRAVTKLILGHNALSDDGCCLLFNFLNSPLGRKHPIAEISLNANSIGNRGLAAISTYLINNNTLTELFLQDNSFTSDSWAVTHLAHAINQSRLRLLSLTTNRLLADEFCRLFFPALCSHHLQELHLSAVGLTHHSASHIADYVTSADRCRLHTLKCNGNQLAFRGVRTIIRAIERANFSLTVVELYSNNIASGQDSEDTEDDANEGAQNHDPEAWRDPEKLLKQVLGRNTHLKKEIWRESLQLLVYSRAVLLRPKEPFNYDDLTYPAASATGFPFKYLPTEIQLYVLSFLAPTLSPSQRARVYTYASSLSTLPPLFPSLLSPSTSSAEPAVFSMCVPDPSVTMGFTNMHTSPVWGVSNSRDRGCAPGKCMGRRSLLCHLEHRRTSWLEQVGCLAYDPGTESVYQHDGLH